MHLTPTQTPLGLSPFGLCPSRLRIEGVDKDQWRKGRKKWREATVPFCIRKRKSRVVVQKWDENSAEEVDVEVKPTPTTTQDDRSHAIPGTRAQSERIY